MTRTKPIHNKFSAFLVWLFSFLKFKALWFKYLHFETDKR